MLSTALVCTFATAAIAHDFWIDAETLRPTPGSTVAVYIRGGHYFPSSEIALADRLIGDFISEIATGRATIASRIEGKQRVATLDIASNEAHRITLQIRRPQQEDPVAWAALYLVPAGAQSDPAAYPRGVGLEIVPRTRIDEARKGIAIPFAVLRDGAPIRAKFQILAAEGGTAWLESKENDPALFTPRKSGRHLALVTDRTQTATLVFEVQP